MEHGPNMDVGAVDDRQFGLEAVREQRQLRSGEHNSIGAREMVRSVDDGLDPRDGLVSHTPHEKLLDVAVVEERPL